MVARALVVSCRRPTSVTNAIMVLIMTTSVTTHAKANGVRLAAEKIVLISSQPNKLLLKQLLFAIVVIGHSLATGVSIRTYKAPKHQEPSATGRKNSCPAARFTTMHPKRKMED